jgi:hypothetical protein
MLGPGECRRAPVGVKSAHVKQSFKEQHALRTETTINNPRAFYVRKAVDNLGYLRERGHQVHRKHLEVERVRHRSKPFSAAHLPRLS